LLEALESREGRRDYPPEGPLGGRSPDWSIVPVSALTGEGLDALQAQMASLVMGGQVAPAEEAMVSNPRHHAALQRAAGHARAALESYRNGMPPDFVTIDLTAAVNALGEITGETAQEDLLDLIFSRFCIGK